MAEEKDNKEPLWYVIHTYSGYENKVKANIEQAVGNRNLKHKILKVLVPSQKVTELKANGKKKEEEKKIFPGYVFVNMVMDDDTWYVVRNTRGVTGFVGPGSKPVPLGDDDLKPLGILTESMVVDFDVNDRVVVVAGPWKDTQSVITRMDMSKQTAVITVELFGRETPVEISFNQISKQK